MAAPGGIELHENVLIIIDDQIGVGVSNNNSYRAFLSLRNGLGLNTGVNLAIENVLNELANFLSINLLGLIPRELGVLSGILDSEGREFLRVEVEIGSMGTKQLGVESSKVDLSTVLFSEGLEVSSKLLALLSGISEDIGQWDASLFMSRSAFCSQIMD